METYSIKNLSLVDGDKEILKNIDLEIGENLTITGPSGSGKSTLLKIIGSMQSATSGDIFYQGENLSEIDPVSYRREVSYCFQQPVLFGQTVRDNLSFPFDLRKLDFDEEKTISMLSAVNLSADFLNQEVAKLSGGEKQRVALVRNLLFAPKVLLLDEVTTGLDAENKAIVRQIINAQEALIIEVTHDAEEIAAAKNLITIDEGRLQ